MQVVRDPEASEVSSSVSQASKWYLVAIFTLTTALLFADQNLLAPNLTEAARDFGFNDKERDQYLGGVLNGAFFIVGAPASILVGYLVDRRDRRWLLFACVVLGEAPCIATVLVTQYWQLFLTRVMTGVAIGGAAPIIYALLSDLFPPSERAAVSTLIVIGTGAGVGMGQALAGWSGPLDWRMPFAMVGVPSIALAVLMVCTTQDPARGLQEAALKDVYTAEGDFQYDGRITWRKLRQLWRILTNVFLIIQGLPGCLPWGMVLVYLNDYLVQEKGLSKEVATTVVLLFASGGGLGSAVGGLGGQALYNRRRGLLALFSGACVWAGMPSLFYLVNGNLQNSSATGLAAAAFVGGAVASVAGVNIKPMLMNVNEPEMRGMAFALHATLDDLGKGLGPALVAVLISWMDRTAAFNLAVCGWIPCGLMLCLSGLTLGRDEDRMQQRLASHVGRQYQSVQLADVVRDNGDDELLLER